MSSSDYLLNEERFISIVKEYTGRFVDFILHGADKQHSFFGAKWCIILSEQIN